MDKLYDYVFGRMVITWNYILGVAWLIVSDKNFYLDVKIRS